MNSPNKNPDTPLRVSIYSEGNLIKPALFGLVSAHIYKGVNRIGKATLEFAAGNMSKNEVPESDDATFAPGKTIRIEAGYGNDESPLFEGTVVNHSFSVTGEEGGILRIECRDYAFPATLARKNALFEKKKDSEAIQEILGKYSPLSPTVDSTKTTFTSLVQYYATDWDFILSRADANGLVIVTDGKKISVKAPTVSASPALKVTYGIDLVEFRGDLSAIQGYCRFLGSSKAIHGGTIELDGLGKRFNGTAYIGYVEHTIREGNWITTAGLGLPFDNITDNPHVMAPAASGFLPGIRGLHTGKVVKLDGDPTNEQRIQVELPLLNGDNNKLWARLASFWASSGYGSFIIPDVGDEVVLGFFNDDPCHAVILGSLYSSKQKPPAELTKENKVRTLLTKSKIKVEFDEEKKALLLETPGKNKVILSDDAKGIQLMDQNNNKIVMDASGILIESAKDLTLKAKMNITVDAGSNLEEKAKANLTLKGLKVEAAAQTEITLKGTAKAELSASGQTIVKGAMVMIN